MSEFTGQPSLFWVQVLYVWEHGFLGVNIGQIIIALMVFGLCLFFRGLISRYILDKLKNWADHSRTDLDNKIIDAISPPIHFVPIILGLFFSMNIIQVDGVLEIFFYRLLRSMIAFTIFWALHRALDPIRYMSRKLEKILTPTMMGWIFKSMKIAVIFIGGAVIFEIWGIAIGPLLAGLGLFGAAVALGAQDLFKNLIGGFTVIAEKRFQPGDWILVKNVVEGTVEEIGFRSTVVRRFDKAPVHVPNSALSDAVVTNFSRMTHRRLNWIIGVTYSTSTEQLKTIRDGIMEYLQNSPDFAQPPEVPLFVRIDNFNASSIDIMVYCFTKTKEWGEFLKIKEDFAFAIKDIVETKAQSSFAFPSQSIYVESVANDKPEPFKPPNN